MKNRRTTRTRAQLSAITTERAGLTAADLEAQLAETLPERAVMSTLNVTFLDADEHGRGRG